MPNDRNRTVAPDSNSPPVFTRTLTSTVNDELAIDDEGGSGLCGVADATVELKRQRESARNPQGRLACRLVLCMTFDDEVNCPIAAILF